MPKTLFFMFDTTLMRISFAAAYFVITPTIERIISSDPIVSLSSDLRGV